MTPTETAPPPHSYEGTCVCGVSERMLALRTLEARFPRDRVTWHLDATGDRDLSADDFRAEARAALASISKRVKVEWVEVDNPADAMCRAAFAYIDGGSGTLAMAELTNGSTRPLRMTIDTGDVWRKLGDPDARKVIFRAVFCHEAIHWMGCGHLPSGVSGLLAPYYSAAITEPTEADVRALVALGYQRAEAPPVPPATPPAGQSDGDRLLAVLTAAGVKVTFPR